MLSSLWFLCLKSKEALLCNDWKLRLLVTDTGCAIFALIQLNLCSSHMLIPPITIPISIPIISAQNEGMLSKIFKKFPPFKMLLFLFTHSRSLPSSIWRFFFPSLRDQSLNRSSSLITSVSFWKSTAETIFWNLSLSLDSALQILSYLMWRFFSHACTSRAFPSHDHGFLESKGPNKLLFVVDSYHTYCSELFKVLQNWRLKLTSYISLYWNFFTLDVVVILL